MLRIRILALAMLIAIPAVYAQASEPKTAQITCVIEDMSYRDNAQIQAEANAFATKIFTAI